MTRTERATSPRAIMKDRSLPRNAMGQEHKKDGAGLHNWGSLRYEQELEEEAEQDEEREHEGEGASAQKEDDTVPPARRPSVTLTEEEKQRAAEIRRKGHKSPDVDLATIARTSHAVSHSQEDQPIPIIGASHGTKNSP